MTGLVMESGHPGSNPFFLMVPGWAVVPLVVLATLATIIASQAIITGAFSMTRQGMQLGWFPGMRIRQTSDEEYGQIYVPVVNWAMMICTLGIAIGFGSSDALAGAYGTAVSTTMLATTVLLYLVMADRWRWNTFVSIAVFVCLLAVDLTFFSANLTKIAEGGWVPLLLGLLLYLLMTTWRDGIAAMQKRLMAIAETPSKLLERLESGAVLRTPGTAVFLTRVDRPLPVLMIRHVEQFSALPRAVVTLSVLFSEAPRISERRRIEITDIADHFWHIVVRYGFMEVPNLTAALADARRHGCDLDTSEALFVSARDSVVRTRTDPLMSAWRQAIFSFLHRNAVHLDDRFTLPEDRFVEIGRRIEI
jgi:KUP system potassium uptake protein